VAAGSYEYYQMNILYWDSYGYMILPEEDSIPELTYTLNAEDEANYPEAVSVLRNVGEEGKMVTYEDGDALYQLNALIDSKDANESYIFLRYNDNIYSVSFQMYGGREDQPIYLWTAGISLLIALALTGSEILRYLRNRG